MFPILARIAATALKAKAKGKSLKIGVQGLNKAHSVISKVDNSKRKAPKVKESPSASRNSHKNLPASLSPGRGQNLPAHASYGGKAAGIVIVESTAKIGELVANAGTLNSNPDLNTAQGRKEKVQQHAFQNQVVILLEQIALNTAKESEKAAPVPAIDEAPEAAEPSFISNGLKTARQVYEQSEKGSLIGFALAALMPTVMKIVSMWNDGTLFDFISESISTALSAVSGAISDYFKSGEFTQDITGIIDSVIGQFGDWVTEAQRGIKDKFLDLEEGFFGKVDDMFVAGGKLMNRIQETMADWWNDKVDFIGKNGVISIPKINAFGKTLFDGFNLDLKIDSAGLRAGNRAEEELDLNAATEAKAVRAEAYEIERQNLHGDRAKEDSDKAAYRADVDAGKSNKVQDAYTEAKSSTLGFIDSMFGTKYSKKTVIPNGNVNLQAKDSPFSVHSQVNTAGLRPELKSRLYGFGKEYQEIFGKKIEITSGYTSISKQDRLFKEAVKKYGSAAEARKWVAPPGSSMHNYGYAVDMNSAQMNNAKKKGLFKKYGLSRPVADREWQVEVAGIDRNKIRENKISSSYVNKAKTKEINRGTAISDTESNSVNDETINNTNITSAEPIRGTREITAPNRKLAKDSSDSSYILQVNRDIGEINKRVSRLSETKGTMQSETIRNY